MPKPGFSNSDPSAFVAQPSEQWLDPVDRENQSTGNRAESSRYWVVSQCHEYIDCFFEGQSIPINRDCNIVTVEARQIGKSISYEVASVCGGNGLQFPRKAGSPRVRGHSIHNLPQVFEEDKRPSNGLAHLSRTIYHGLTHMFFDLMLFLGLQNLCWIVI